MAMNDRRGGTRRIFIIILAALTAGTTACLALLRNSIGQSLSVLLGYVILFMSSVLMNLCIAGSTDETKRTALLVFSLGILVFFLGGMIHILFSDDETEYTATPSVAEAHITEHPAEVIGTADDETGIQVADEKDEAYITPIITEPHETSGSTEETEEPLSHSLDEDYHNDEGPLQSTAPFIAADSEEKASAPAAPEMYFTITDITEDEPVAEEIIFEPPPVPEETTVAEMEKESASPQLAAAETVDAIEAETESIQNEEVVIANIDEFLSDISDEEEEVLGYYKGNRWDDEDFWSTFYIAGEEEFVLADGIYYMDLHINGENVGTIETEIVSGEAYINADEFRSYIEGSVVDDVVERIFAGNTSFHIPLTYFQSIGIPAEFNSEDYVISVAFSPADMPVQIISIKSSGSPFARRPIAGAEVINPAVFYLASRYSLTTSFDIARWNRFKNSLSFSFTSSNNFRLYDVYGSFSYYINWNPDYARFRFGSYNMYTDFQDEMIRLEWGNIDTDLLVPAGTAIGVGFEKSLSYARPGTRSRSHIERLLIIEKESDVQILNEGREIFRRTLQPGSYRLQDFVLYTGANRIRIIVSPLDGSPVDEMDIDINYSSSLLAPGEVYFGAALATGRETYSSRDEKRSGTIRIPLSSTSGLEYDARNLVLSGNINAGITESLTADLALAIQNSVSDKTWFNPSMAAALELTHANVLGTTRYSIRATEHMDGTRFTLPDLYGRIGHQVYFDTPYLSSLSISGTYSGDTVENSISASLGLSGTVGIISWGVNGYISSDLIDIDGVSWNTSGSISLSAGRNVWISASMDIGVTSGTHVPSVSGRVSATLRFGGGNANASWSNTSSSLSANIYNSRNHFSARLDTNNLVDINAYSLSADYSYDGDFVNFSASVDANDVFKDTRGSFTLSTSTLFADGLFTVRSSIPSNFLLIKQDGILKGNELSIGSAGSSSSMVLNNIFGSYLYSGLSATRDTSLSLYSTTTSSFASSKVFDITLPATNRRGFVLRLNAEATYTYSGVVYSDGGPWMNGASPLYSLSKNSEGDWIFTETEFYLFTDSDGRFVMSGLQPGFYAFDVMSEAGWISYIFEVVDDEENSLLVHMLGNPSETTEINIDEPYVGALLYSIDSVLSSEDFWYFLYPEMAEVAV